MAVTASGETAPVGTGRADAADDPAIWVDPANPGRALIVATDKKAGLHVYDLNGKDLAFLKSGLVNNVDIVGDIVVASDRNDGVNAHLAVYRLDGAKPALTALGRAAAGSGEAYGLCLKKTAPGAPITAALIVKDGTVRVGTLTVRWRAPTFTVQWEHKIATQSEGCVFDGDTLYVGEEVGGLWELKQDGKGAAARLVAPIDNQRLVADLEGLATIDHKGQRYLIASSQGDNAYAVFRLPGVEYVGRFAVTAGRVRRDERDRRDRSRRGQFRPGLSRRHLSGAGRRQRAQGAEFQAGALGYDRGGAGALSGADARCRRPREGGGRWPPCATWIAAPAFAGATCWVAV